MSSFRKVVSSFVFEICMITWNLHHFIFLFYYPEELKTPFQLCIDWCHWHVSNVTKKLSFLCFFLNTQGIFLYMQAKIQECQIVDFCLFCLCGNTANNFCVALSFFQNSSCLSLLICESVVGTSWNKFSKGRENYLDTNERENNFSDIVSLLGMTITSHVRKSQHRL